LTTFEMRSNATGEYGAIVRRIPEYFSRIGRTRQVFVLLRCAGCGRGGLATIIDDGAQMNGDLVDFYPLQVEIAKLPSGVPDGVVREDREAEQCASVGAWRAASALLRSALEKALVANGYTKTMGNLKARIDVAADDGAITAARSRRAHDDVRSLGNDVLHDDWRPVDQDEYETAHHYVLRVLEDLYDDRETVERLLVERGRVEAPTDDDTE